MERFRSGVSPPYFYRQLVLARPNINISQLKRALKCSFECVCVAIEQMTDFRLQDQISAALLLIQGGADLATIRAELNLSPDELARNFPVLCDVTEHCQHSLATNYWVPSDETLQVGVEEYVGQVKDGVPHGDGTMKNSTYQRYYSGGWQNGFRSGYGIEYTISGVICEGEWENGLLNGQGSTNRKYCGCFKQGKMNGFGTLFYTDEETYQGMFKDDKRHGVGTIKPDRTYTGAWVNDTMCGYGVYEFKYYDFSESYAGEWLGNMKHGLGTQISNKLSFTGMWVKGTRQGFGVEQLERGDKYEGNWIAQKIEGEGTLTKADGTVLKGVFKTKGKGSGTAVFPNGDCYEGRWSKGLLKGNGIMTITDGRVYRGNFLNNQMHGIGVMTYPNGDLYRGHFRQGEADGDGEFFSADGKVLRGMFKQGKEHGTMVTTWPDGVRYTSDWERGKLLSERLLSEGEDCEAETEFDVTFNLLSGV
jgi:hypothetical protein